MQITDWDDAYANRDHIPDADSFITRWPADAAAFRNGLGARAELDIPYGGAERNRFDLFHPDGASKGLVVWVHGGYWRLFDKSVWSHFTEGAVAAGWTVAAPSYTLAPAIGIGGIVSEISAAVSAAATRIPGEIRLVGHSAGGHLVTEMVTETSPLPRGILDRIALTLSVSGLHDLRPLIKTAMNDDFKLTDAEAARLSPALKRPVPGARVIAAVGTDERPEFVRQTTLLANIWTGLGAEMSQIKVPGKHHFDVIDGLRTPDGNLSSHLLA